MVATETADDGGVFLLDKTSAIVQTVDFFTPVVDDPEDFGRVAAANSLSDIYAMGGRPITALAIACFPEKRLAPEILAAIMKGAVEKLDEAGCSLLGGHSVDDEELKFGLAVTGTIDPKRILRNSTAREGDQIVLTKPLGTGILASAGKKGKLSPEATALLVAVMTELNASAAKAAIRRDLHAATDVTGYGLLGHTRSMARASGVAMTLRLPDIPLLPELDGFVRKGFLTKGDKTNYELVKPDLLLRDGITRRELAPLLDPQTSGGLLLALPTKEAAALAGELGPPAAIIGSVTAWSECRYTG